jgi:hypothetical protein
MRKLAVLGAILIAGCTTAPAEPVVHGVTPGHKCVAEGTDRFIGQPGNSETGEAIMKATHAAVLRWAPPGYMLTMDYREDRVTVRLGPDRKVTAINCG